MKNMLAGIVSDQDFASILVVVRNSSLPKSMHDDAIQQIGVALLEASEPPADVTLFAKSEVWKLGDNERRWQSRQQRAAGFRREETPSHAAAVDAAIDEAEIVAKMIVETDQEYHGNAGRFLSSHLLKDFRECPQLYLRKVQGLIADKDRPAYIVGRAAHAMILEGREAFDERFAVGGPVNPTTGKPYGNESKAFKEWAETVGKDVITETQFEQISRMAESVRSHRYAAELLREGYAERVARAEYAGKQCQIRMDWFSLRECVGIVDLKTCDDLAYFEADAKRYGYRHQVAFYRAVLAAAIGKVLPAHIVAVEKKEPYRCGVWELPREVLDECERENAAAIGRLLRSEATQNWPTGYETPRMFAAA